MLVMELEKKNINQRKQLNNKILSARIASYAFAGGRKQKGDSMNDQELNPKRLEDMKNFLEPFGFVSIGGGSFKHRLINRVFDFSAASPDGIIKIIFDMGVNVGVTAKENEIKSALGIPY